MKLNQRAYEHAERLIGDRKVVLEALMKTTASGSRRR
jgi:hypothetical protein